MSVRSWISERAGGCESAPITSPPSWSRAFGVALLLSFAICGVTGLGMSFVYAPSVASAWASVFYAEHMLAGGWLVRSLHKAAAEASIIFGVMALLLAVFEGRYRGRRDLAFWCRALVVLLAFGFCITGNPLRWDNRGYYGFQTETNIGAALPGGKMLVALVVGGGTLGNWTLARLYALHTLLLPLVAGSVVWLWAKTSRRAEGSVDGQPAAVLDRSNAQLSRDFVLALIVLVEIFVVAFAVRAPLESPADPIASYDARPEWYFQALYVLRNAVPPKMQALVAGGTPAVLGAIILALPFLGRGRELSSRQRAPHFALLAVPVVAFAALTWAGLHHDKTDPVLQKALASQDAVSHRALQIAKATGIPPAGALAMMRADPIFHGEDLYREHCASCHVLGDMGPADGKATGPKLDGWGTESWAMAMMDDPDHKDKFGLLPGFKGKMPSYTHEPSDPEEKKGWKPMPEEQRRSIAKWLAREGEENAPLDHDTDGYKLAKQRCSGCHLLRGDTDDPDDIAPELAGWGTTAWMRQQIADPGTNATYRPGSMSAQIEGHMPRFVEKIAPADLDLLARFVRFRARGLVSK
jgi:ubiquinol-cytochrome c reductase cytochrome b subunit